MIISNPLAVAVAVAVAEKTKVHKFARIRKQSQRRRRWHARRRRLRGRGRVGALFWELLRLAFLLSACLPAALWFVEPWTEPVPPDCKRWVNARAVRLLQRSSDRLQKTKTKRKTAPRSKRQSQMLTATAQPTSKPNLKPKANISDSLSHSDVCCSHSFTLSHSLALDFSLSLSLGRTLALADYFTFQRILRIPLFTFFRAACAKVRKKLSLRFAWAALSPSTACGSDACFTFFTHTQTAEPAKRQRQQRCSPHLIWVT